MQTPSWTLKNVRKQNRKQTGTTHVDQEALSRPATPAAVATKTQQQYILGLTM